MGYQQTIKTIDLSAFIEKTLDVTLLDGTTIQLKRPTQGIALKIRALQTTTDLPEQEKLARDIVLSAFNNNTANRQFSPDEINEMPSAMIFAILKAYFEFMAELVNNPNSESLPSRTSTEKKGAKKSKSSLK